MKKKKTRKDSPGKIFKETRSQEEGEVRFWRWMAKNTNNNLLFDFRISFIFQALWVQALTGNIVLFFFLVRHFTLTEPLFTHAGV